MRGFVAAVRKFEEHAVDDTEVVAVLEADNLLSITVAGLAGGIDVREPGGPLHRRVEVDAGRVAPADHLAAAQHLLRAHLIAAHFPDEGVVLAVGDWLALPGHRGE